MLLSLDNDLHRTDPSGHSFVRMTGLECVQPISHSILSNRSDRGQFLAYEQNL